MKIKVKPIHGIILLILIISLIINFNGITNDLTKFRINTVAEFEG
jgi:hypothetical protein